MQRVHVTYGYVCRYVDAAYVYTGAENIICFALAFDEPLKLDEWLRMKKKKKKE